MNFCSLQRHTENEGPRKGPDLKNPAPPPLLFPLLSYALGAAGVSTLGLPGIPALQAGALGVLAYLLYRRFPDTAAVTATALIWGGISTWIALTPAPYHVKLMHKIENQHVALEGEVLRVEVQPQRWRMDMQVKKIRYAGSVVDARKMRVRIHVANGEPNIYPGDHVHLRTKLRKPRAFGTPGEFNYSRYLLQRDITASGFIADGNTIARTAAPRAMPLSARIARWRQRTATEMAAVLPQDSAAYVLSLAFGEKSRFSPEQRQTLAFTGLSHLFSISGLHLGMIAACLYIFIQHIYKQSSRLLLWQPVQKTSPLLCMPGVILYLLLSGSALPTLRAAVMLGVAALLALLNYRTRPSAVLILAAALILIADPLALESASFQLSFAGVGALLLVLPAWHQRLKRGWRRTFTLLLLTSATACLATAPFALWHFHTFAPAAVINNIFAVPLVSFIILPLTLSGAALFSLAPACGLPPLELSASLITHTLEWSKALAAGPLAGRYIYLSQWGFAAFSLGCAGLVIWAAQRRRLTITLFVAAFILFLTGITYEQGSGKLELTALSIGQADAFLIRTPENRSYLVDGGGLRSETFDTGARLIAPALQHLGVTHLDAVILTHDHPDHSDGLHHILRYFPTSAFLCGTRPRNLNPELQEVLHHAQAPPVVTLPEGMVRLDKYIYLHTPNQNQPEVNEHSIAVYGGYGEEGFLLTGDLETKGMMELLRTEAPSPVTLFKLPHHGSRNALPQRWLETWDITSTVVSCGRYNHFGFPHPDVCNMLKNADIPLWRTDIHGTVQFSTRGKGWKVKSWKITRTNP